jgi:2-C-methyl-D-erythritol 2,4-cyclodiphosphate synthase
MTGIGYDVHRFSPDRPLILGGVEIPHTHGLEGHSDADVLSHAVADAVLGAIGQPAIGHWFPPGDPACKDISSLKILEKAAALGLPPERVNIKATTNEPMGFVGRKEGIAALAIAEVR